MGAIDDSRKLLQDFIAPEIREVSVKLQALADLQKAMREDMLAGQKGIREDMLAGQKGIREDMLAGQKAIRDDMAAGQKAMREDMLNGQKAAFESQREMELRLLREIVRSEERISLLLKVANLTDENAALNKRLAEKESGSSAH